MRGDFIFLLQMQRNQVAGSIPAGCIFYSRGDYDHHGRTWRSAPLRRFCTIEGDSKCRETYKRDHLIICGQAQRPAPTKGLSVNELAPRPYPSTPTVTSPSTMFREALQIQVFC